MRAHFNLTAILAATGMMQAAHATAPASPVVTPETMICNLWESHSDYALTADSKAKAPYVLALRYDLKATRKLMVLEADGGTYKVYDPDSLMHGSPANPVHKFLDAKENEYMAGSGLDGNGQFSMLMVGVASGMNAERPAKLAKTSLRKGEGPAHFYAGSCVIVTGASVDQSFEGAKAQNLAGSEK